MNWQLLETLPWAEPLSVARNYHAHDIALLYSSLRESFSGGMSYLFIDPVEERCGSDWAQLPAITESGNEKPTPVWVGYLGYGMSDEALRGTPSPITLPDFRLVRYAQMIRFDHTRQTISQYVSATAAINSPLREWSGTGMPSETAAVETPPPSITSNITRNAYDSIINATVAQTHAGNFYQANITRKFYGEFAQQPDSFAIFSRLTEASPAPYSAYIRHCGTAIASSSPECFLNINASGIMTTRPIKGSARRSADKVTDKIIREALAASKKNHAENLMIVDLMRNDLARVSTTGSLKVIEQSALYSYSTIHHLISTIRAEKCAGVSSYDAVRACFPAGSMTGAPKIAAMRWCAAQEKIERGVYSGVIGWFGTGDTCDLSVVIRTIIMSGRHFEFQVGGGIVADSTAEDEWRETMTKARGILAALELTEDDLARL